METLPPHDQEPKRDVIHAIPLIIKLPALTEVRAQYENLVREQAELDEINRSDDDHFGYDIPFDHSIKASLGDEEGPLLADEKDSDYEVVYIDEERQLIVLATTLETIDPEKQVEFDELFPPYADDEERPYEEESVVFVVPFNACGASARCAALQCRGKYVVGPGHQLFHRATRPPEALEEGEPLIDEYLAAAEPIL